MVYILLILLVIFILIFNPAIPVIVAVVGVALLFLLSQANIPQKDEEQDKINKSRERITKELESISFSESQEIYLTTDSISPKLKIDQIHKRIALIDYYKDEFKIIPFSNLLECQILEDNETALSGGIGRAVIGGAIAGGTGAIVGAATRKSKSIANSLSLKIITSDTQDSLIVIPILESATKRDSEKYKQAWNTAQKAHATIISIIKTSETASPSRLISSSNDPLSQIEMLAKLRDQGILTEEEFSTKKAELLNKM